MSRWFLESILAYNFLLEYLEGLPIFLGMNIFNQIFCQKIFMYLRMP